MVGDQVHAVDTNVGMRACYLFVGCVCKELSVRCVPSGAGAVVVSRSCSRIKRLSFLFDQYHWGLF
jgi:hypothetical protein